MWIVELALRRPYTFVVIALLITIMSSIFMFVTPKDIFPNINIPIVSVIWQYTGLPPEEFSERITTFSEYSLFNNVDNIERIESQTLNGVGVIRIYFHPGADIPTAIAEATSTSQSILKRMPPGILPPTVLRYYVNTVPIVQMILSGEATPQSQLYDYGNWRIRQFIGTIPGATLPTPFGGEVRQLMVDVDSLALQTRGLSARDVNQAIQNQVLTTPLGDARIGIYDYNINVNNTPIEPNSFNDMPVATVDDKIVFLRDVAFAHDGFAPQGQILS
jgi:multidrug efflux pump subunit AcrB